MNQKLASPQSSVSSGTPPVNRVDRPLKMRMLLFGAWVLLSSLLLAKPLGALLRMSLGSDDVSYLIFIPFVGAWTLFADRRRVFQSLSYAPTLAGGLFSCAVCVGLLASLVGRRSFDLRLSSLILALVLLWISGFLLLFGRAASRAARFPLLFLLLMVPLPQFLLARIIYLLQAGSAWITGEFFDLVGVPALREGFVFHLPTINIEVAQECSGIRSSMALLILALVTAHFYLKNFWSKALFVICGLFVMIVKNGIRIATLTLLAVYVDPTFLTGSLHHRGGIVFFLTGLLLMLPVLWLLQRGETGTLEIERPSPSLL